MCDRLFEKSEAYPPGHRRWRFKSQLALKLRGYVKIVARIVLGSFITTLVGPARSAAPERRLAVLDNPRNVDQASGPGAEGLLEDTGADIQLGVITQMLGA